MGKEGGRDWGLGHQANQTSDPRPVCLSAASYALQSCSVLTGELFAPCSAYLSPVPYFEQCRRDTCRCGQPCLCATLAHYAHLCQRHGLPVDFRAHLPACGERPTLVCPCEDGWRSRSSRSECPPAPLNSPLGRPTVSSSLTLFPPKLLLLLCSPSLPRAPIHGLPRPDTWGTCHLQSLSKSCKSGQLQIQPVLTTTIATTLVTAT